MCGDPCCCEAPDRLGRRLRDRALRDGVGSCRGPSCEWRALFCEGCGAGAALRLAGLPEFGLGCVVWRAASLAGVAFGWDAPVRAAVFGAVSGAAGWVAARSEGAAADGVAAVLAAAFAAAPLRRWRRRRFGAVPACSPAAGAVASAVVGAVLRVVFGAGTDGADGWDEAVVGAVSRVGFLEGAGCPDRRAVSRSGVTGAAAEGVAGGCSAGAFRFEGACLALRSFFPARA